MCRRGLFTLGMREPTPTTPHVRSKVRRPKRWVEIHLCRRSHPPVSQLERSAKFRRKAYSGMSYKQIAENMVEMYDIPEPSKATIYEWVRDNTAVALREMENHKAQTGDEWVADEMQVTVDGQKYWNWNVMDTDTRYILASHLSKRRDARAATAVMRKVSRVSMFSDYVRLTVQGKCPLLSSECYQTKWIPLVLERVPRADSQLPCTSWPCSYGYPTPEQSLESTPPCASPSVQLSILLSEVAWASFASRLIHSVHLRHRWQRRRHELPRSLAPRRVTPVLQSISYRDRCDRSVERTRVEIVR